MDYFDKKINELYNQPEQDVPNDLSWDFMEDSIYSRMEDKKPKRRAFWYWFTGGIVAIALVLIYFIMFSATENTSNFATNNSNHNTKNNLSIPKTSTSTTVPQLETTNNPASTDIAIGEEKQLISDESKPINQSDAFLENVIDQKNQFPEDKSTTPINNIAESSDTQSNSIIGNNFDTYELNNPINTDNEISEIKSTTETLRNVVNFEKVVSVTPNTLDVTREKIKSNTSTINFDLHPSKIEDKRNTKYAFSILGGTSFNSGYNIQNSEYTSSLPGYSARLGISIEKKNGWGYELGIGHALLVEKFDFEKIDTVPTHQQGIVVSHLTNSLTGNTTNVIGDAYRDSSRRRRELSYNTINLLSVDAIIYKRINLSHKWSMLPSAGLQYDRILKIEGKSLDNNGEVFPYDNETANINKNLLSGKLGLRLDYNLSHKISLSASINQTLSANKLYNNDRQLGVTYLQGGLSFTL